MSGFYMSDLAQVLLDERLRRAAQQHRVAAVRRTRPGLRARLGARLVSLGERLGSPRPAPRPRVAR